MNTKNTADTEQGQKNVWPSVITIAAASKGGFIITSNVSDQYRTPEVLVALADEQAAACAVHDILTGATIGESALLVDAMDHEAEMAGTTQLAVNLAAMGVTSGHESGTRDIQAELEEAQITLAETEMAAADVAESLGLATKIIVDLLANPDLHTPKGDGARMRAQNYITKALGVDS